MLVTLRSNAIKEMKRPFRLNSANKALLLDKFIVLKLRGHRKGDTSHWGRAIARLEQRSPEPEDKVYFLHIGHPCLSPYEPTFKVTRRSTYKFWVDFWFERFRFTAVYGGTSLL